MNTTHKSQSVSRIGWRASAAVVLLALSSVVAPFAAAQTGSNGNSSRFGGTLQGRNGATFRSSSGLSGGAASASALNRGGAGAQKRLVTTDIQRGTRYAGARTAGNNGQRSVARMGAATRQVSGNTSAAVATSRLRSLGAGRWQLGSGPRALTLNRQAVRSVISGGRDDESVDRTHGVFDAGRRGALGVVHTAWERVQSNAPGVRSTPGRNGTTVYTVPMGSRIGFIGGRAGAQMGRPEAHHVRIVARGNDLVMAYPHRATGADAADAGGDAPSGGAFEASASAGGAGDLAADLDIGDRALEALDRQTADDASLPRTHGVFDGGREGALSTIREAWGLVRTGGPNVETRPGRVEGALIYRVPLNRPIGFIGGARGATAGNPRSTHVEMVVRNGRLLTAYPVALTQRGAARTTTAAQARQTASSQARTTRQQQTSNGSEAVEAAGEERVEAESRTPSVGELLISDRVRTAIESRTADVPDSTRVHTVFNGGPEGALETIHEAWTKVQANDPDIEPREGREPGVTVYRVDLGRDVGYVGGQQGAEQGRPAANVVDLVARGNRLISAYPVRDQSRIGMPRFTGRGLQLEGRTLRIPSTAASQREAVTGRLEERQHPPQRMTAEQLQARLLARARTARNTPIQPGRAAGAVRHLVTFGLPSDSNGETPGADDNDRLIVSRDSVISYNASRRLLNWQAWTMTADTMGDAPRTDDVRGSDNAWERPRVEGLDPRLPRDMPQADNDDYKGTGYHRGHIRDSGAFTNTTTANARTYTLTNAVPQASGSNLGAWNGLENYLRVMAREGNSVNVVAGPLFRGDPRTIGNGVQVPSALWKIAIINPAGVAPGTVNASTRIIAGIFPNNNREARRDQSWTDFRTNVRTIESQTGLRFFTNLPQNEANQLRDHSDATDVPPELRVLRSHGTVIPPPR